MGAEAPWDVWERVVPALLFSHAAAALLAGVFTLPTAGLFLVLAAVAVAAVLCYHNLKVTAAGKGILITGCDSKIGFALARRLDELGFTVFAGFMHLDDPLAEKLREASSGRLHVLQLDVTSEDEIQAASSYVKEHLPPGTIGLWAVVNNASWASFGEVEWVPFPVFKRAAEVNLLSAIRVTQVFLPSIRRTKGWSNITYNITHSFLFCNSSSPICQLGLTPLSIRYIIYECPAFDQHRSAGILESRLSDLASSEPIIKEILQF